MLMGAIFKLFNLINSRVTGVNYTLLFRKPLLRREIDYKCHDEGGLICKNNGSMSFRQLRFR